MTILRALAALVALALPLATVQAHAAELKVLASTALKAVLEELSPQFERATENKVVLTFGPAAVMKKQIETGAAFDISALTASLNDSLAGEGKLGSAARATIARAGMGVGVRKGAPTPDVSTTAAFKTAMMNATSIGFNGQGASRAGFEALFNKLGIADALKSKIKLLKTGAPEGVTSGEVEIGLGPVSEFLPVQGVALAGPLPADIQSYLVFTAGVAAASKSADAAKAYIEFLTSPAATPVLRSKGMEPG